MRDYAVLQEPNRNQIDPGPSDCMGFEDFVWFLLSYYDRLNPQSIRYWFRVLDLDGNGNVCYWEMERFYRVIHHKREMQQLETFEFSAIVCLLKDMFDFPKDSFTVEDLISNREAGAMFTAIFTDHFRFSEFVERKTFVLPAEPAFSHWVKYVEYEYADLTRGKDDEEFEEGFDLAGEEGFHD